MFLLFPGFLVSSVVPSKSSVLVPRSCSTSASLFFHSLNTLKHDAPSYFQDKAASPISSPSTSFSFRIFVSCSEAHLMSPNTFMSLSLYIYLHFSMCPSYWVLKFVLFQDISQMQPKPIHSPRKREDDTQRGLRTWQGCRKHYTCLLWNSH